jgi:hypothetical protein
VDKGKGGKYLILPPGYQGKVSDGYIPTPSNTYQSYAVLRSNLASGSENDAADAGGVGKFVHHREPTPFEKQPVIRMNRDTLYSAAVFDLDAGPVTVTLPYAGKRFMSMQVIDEDHYTRPAIYRPGSYTFTRKEIATRYVVIAIRTLVDPGDPNDIEQVHALQDAIKVDQPSGPGKFEVPNWDPVSQKKVRDALLVLASTVTDTSRAFGTRDEVDPVQRLIGAPRPGEPTHRKMPLILTSCPATTMAARSTGSTCKRSLLMGSGRSVSTAPRAIIKRTSTRPTRLTPSRRRRAPTALLGSSSAGAMARSPTACRRCRAGTTWFASTARAQRS